MTNPMCANTHPASAEASDGRRFEVETVESYIKHRPLSAMTTDVSLENVQRIQEVLSALTLNSRRHSTSEWWRASYISITGT